MREVALRYIVRGRIFTRGQSDRWALRGVTFVEDSAAPVAPVVQVSEPGSPSREPAPRIAGTVLSDQAAAGQNVVADAIRYVRLGEARALAEGLGDQRRHRSELCLWSPHGLGLGNWHASAGLGRRP